MIKYPVIGISIFIIFFIGIYVGSAEIFPYQVLKSIKNQISNVSLEDMENEVNSRFEPSNYIKLKNEDDVKVKKNQLIDYIWNDNKLSNKEPTKIDIETDNDFQFRNLDNIEAFEVKMEHNVNSIIYIFHPLEKNNDVMIYHQGHSGGFKNGKLTIEQFVNSGYTVAAFSMPLIGMNDKPMVELENIGLIKLQKHNQFEFVKTDEFSPIKYFLEPINQTLNYLEKNYEFSQYHMIGISGGGWTTTVYPAIDDRISNSFAVSGSIPLPLRYKIQDIGDWEQNDPELYKISNYLELYVMNSVGEGREFVQIFNRYDPCCFDGTPYELYQDEVKTALREIGSGQFSIFLDESHREHKISEITINYVLENIEEDYRDNLYISNI